MNFQYFLIIFLSLLLLLHSIYKLGNTIEKENKTLIEKILNKFTKTIFSSFLTGIFICLITQSSSIITILTISLISSKILSLRKGLAIVIGSNIGTTIISLIISFDIGSFYYIFFIITFILLFIKKSLSKVFLYIGLIFLSLDLLTKHLLIVFNNSFLEDMLFKFNNPLLGILAGVIISFLIQSSSTTIAVAQKMYFNNLLSSLLGISIMLGANIGTTISGLIFSMKSSLEAKRLSVAGMLFNILGVLVFIPFLYIYKEYINLNNSAYLISIAHIYFNVITGILGLFIITPLCKISSFLVR